MAASRVTPEVPESANESDVFKVLFKHYKCKNPTPEYVNVIDFDKEAKNVGSVCRRIPTQLPENDDSLKAQCDRLGLTSPHTWKAFSIVGYEGSFFISNPFIPSGQRFWAKQCLSEYPKKPNVTNLEGDKSVKDVDDLWTHHVFHETCAKHSQLSKLRWATLGYHHNWDTKVYDLDHSAPFPAALASLTTLLVSALGFADYRAQAAIVNYYTMASNIGGHTDHSELDHQSPLVSISFGQSAIFLLGGTTKATEPIAMFLKSGDIVVMSGPTRLSYHAVPRVVAAQRSPWKDEVLKITSDADDQNRKKLCDYLDSHRININIRQVFPNTDHTQHKRLKLSL